MINYDFTPLMRTAIGFDRLARQIEAAARNDDATAYPPYNIERLGENEYRITLAVAGFSEAELEIEVHDNTLGVSGRKAAKEGERNYLHKGIATRDFVRKFELADHVRVEGARLADGLLTIELVREIPEAMKPRRIEIATVPAQAGEGSKLIEGPAKKKAA